VWHPDPKLEWARHRTSGKGGFSATFARDIIRLLLSAPGGLIVDPFSGTGQRTAAAEALGHMALGIDISHLAIKTCLKRGHLIEGSFLVGDARTLPIRSESVDLVFTSPPYWKVERYESVVGQLSDCSTYRRFLAELRHAFAEMYRVLKPGGFAAVVVANFRRWGAYYPLITDSANLLRSVGFTAWDNIVLVREATTPLGAERSIMRHHTKAAHDECLVFRKDPRP
jgi:DNA modification methylase